MGQSYHFRNIITGEYVENLWKYLNPINWENIYPESFEYNNLIGVLNRSEAKPVVGEFIPIYRGMKWDDTSKRVLDPTYIPKRFNADMSALLEAVSAFFKQYEGKKIGVQLSGGLDSSIVIGLLKYFKIPFYLVGMSTTRYEFRTERHVQQLLREWAVESVLLDYESYLPLSDLQEVPKHQHPDLLVNNYSSNRAMALECKKLGVEVLLTGEGGDNLFAEAISMKPEHCTWIPQSFGDTWLPEMVYSPCGVDLVPFYEGKGILDAIYNLRIGQNEDNAKLWAREYFKEFIPSELVNYTYCADFWGIYISGLQKVIPEIKVLFEKSFEITQNKYFSQKAINELLSQDLLNAKKDIYQKIEARIALAVWINSLNK